MASGLIFSIFDNTLSSKNAIKFLMQSTLSSRVRIRTLRHIIDENTSKYSELSDLNCICKVCGHSRLSQVCSYLVPTLLNISANNFTLLLNRRETAKKLV